ncbi:MAG: hypothetical protein ABH827_06865 [bacterium]
METKAPWENLKALVSSDKGLFEKKESIKNTTYVITRNQSLITQLHALIEEKKQFCEKQRKNVSQQEKFAQEIKERENISRKHLDKASNQKEYVATEKELASISKELTEQEDALISSWGHLEQAEKKYAQEQEQNTLKIEELNKEIETKTEIIKTEEIALGLLEEQRLTAIKHIPADWLIRYERMKNSVPDPIVPMINNSCSACFYSVLQQDLYRLKKSELLHCRSCYRFLYYDAEEEKESTKATF